MASPVSRAEPAPVLGPLSTWGLPATKVGAAGTLQMQAPSAHNSGPIY